ncbi:MAG: hypothetical protein LBK82_17550 [Planctomycetaceae bacterium]|jgi:hypothetical protein|nr:hypothetical protein [Planctomycetaceae bacterium]
MDNTTTGFVHRKVGFFMLNPTDNSESGFVGAMLITDEKGLPLEFKCTEAVKPNKTQRVLYGEHLKPYIAINLSMIPLLQRISNENKPDIIFVCDNTHLEVRNEIALPVLFLKPANNAQEIGNAYIPQAAKRFSDDSNTGLLLELNFDLLEPFDRIKTATEILGTQDERFR